MDLWQKDQGTKNSDQGTDNREQGIPKQLKSLIFLLFRESSSKGVPLGEK